MIYDCPAREVHIRHRLDRDALLGEGSPQTQRAIPRQEVMSSIATASFILS